VTEAIAANPIAVLVPCHRVIKKDGSISGYRWGVKRKRELLAREQRSDGLPARLKPASP
jgi:AraC family transcriptional regulator of adaptative response/methylated-DNA-[protein]-cysteine methyltransferase